MKLASYLLAGQSTWGIVDGDTVFHVGLTLQQHFPDLKSLLAAEAYDQALAAKPTARTSPVQEIAWLPVIPNPSKILCVGLNYESHRKETGRAEVQHPTLFTRFANTQVGHLGLILRPRVSRQLDFEGELAVIIGRGGRHLDREHAMEHVAGFACYNDASVRDWQTHTPQFTPGKNFPATGGFGPWMATPDELGELAPLHIETRLNGQRVQYATLGEMIFDIPTILAYCSTFTQLEPGDILVTGTPSGVGVKRTPPLWLQPGDTVEVEIEGLGTLSNRVGQEP